jgi:hypothetical protein
MKLIANATNIFARFTNHCISIVFFPIVPEGCQEQWDPYILAHHLPDIPRLSL